MTLSGFDLIRAAYDVPGLDEHERAVLVLLAFMANGEGEAWPSIAYIVEKTGAAERTVQRAIKRLCAAGHIHQRRRRHDSAVYTVRPDPKPVTVTGVPVTGVPLTPVTQAPRPVTLTPKLPRTTNPQKATPSSGEREPRGSRLDPDFEIPDEWITWAIEQRGWSLTDAHDEGARFRDYWIAQPGKAGRKSDWPATWRNWVRGSRRQPAGQGGKTMRARQMLEDRMKERGLWQD